MTISRRIGRFALDRRIIVLLILAGLVVAARTWLAENPQHDPWAPLDLNDPPGWATQNKISSLRGDPQQCRAILERSGVAFSQLEPAGEGACRREDRTVLSEAPLSPRKASTTCAVAVGTELWLRRSVRPAAQEIFGSDLATVEHYGTYSCRRLYGAGEGPWSEHATANAIDFSAFVLEDGTRISVLGDWGGADDKARFLTEVRDDACEIFATVLSPDYNAAHANHFHFDQATRAWGACR